jgi:hypothetical protein
MTFMNWLPELCIFLQLFVMLTCLNFRSVIYRSLPLLSSGVSLITLAYFAWRSDLAFFDPPVKMLTSDSLATFGRMFALLCLGLGSLNLHFHRSLTFGAKQRATLFLLFFAFFLCGAFQANSILLFCVSWAGAYLSVARIILIESKLSESWIRSFRQHTLPLALIVCLFILLSVVMAQVTGSIYISDFVVWIKTAQDRHGLMLAVGGFILTIGSLLVHGMILQGEGPLSLALLNLFIWTTASLFWFRIGVPFLEESAMLPKEISQHVIGLMFGVFALRYSVQAFRTRSHFQWLSAIYPASIGMGFFVILLGVDRALPAFYILSLSYLFTFLFAGQAFLEIEYRNKALTVFGLLALIGFPPLVLGDQYFRLIRNTFEAGLLPLSILLVLIWFTLSVSVMQMLSKVILVKNGLITYRKIFAYEVLFIVIYTIGVISLTALRPALIALLNDHPVSYLW